MLTEYRNNKRHVLLASLAILLGGHASAQSQYGTIRGVVRDGSGSAVASAKVKATNQQTGLGFETRSNEIGEYAVGGLLPGLYRVTAEASGFKTIQIANRELNSGAILRVDLQLEVGDVAQAVTVEERGTLINTETATVAAQMPTQLLERPPTLRHLSWNPAETAAAFLPGQNYGGGTAISAYGARSYDRKVTLDGAQINSPNQRMPRGSVETVEGFSLNSPVEFQTSNTTKMNTTKGTNELHGEVWTEFHNGALNALPYYATGSKRPPGIPAVYRGVNVGGPVWIPKLYNGRNKTFFFFAFQDLPNNSFGVQAKTAPTDAMRGGNLSPLSTALKNPFSGGVFANNTIPRELLSPVTQKLLDRFYPRVANNVFGLNNISESGLLQGKAHDYLLRGDQQLGSKNRASMTFGRTYTSPGQPQGFSGSTNTFLGTGDVSGPRPVWFLNFSDAHIVNSSLLNEFHFGIQNASATTELSLRGQEIASAIGLPLASGAPNISGGPSFRISDMTGVSFLSPSSSKNVVYNLRDNLSWNKRNFTTKVGFEMIRMNDDSQTFGDVFGTYQFTGLFTGSGFGDFLLGLPSTTSRALPLGPVGLRRNQWGVYADEDIRVTSKLNVNVGLRYQRNNPTRELNNLMYNFDIASGNLVVPSQQALGRINPGLPAAIRNRIVAAGAGFPERLVQDQSGFSPRAGLAYRAFRDTVFRAGYGMFDGLTAVGAFTGGPFTPGAEDYTNSLQCQNTTSCRPLFDLSNPFPSGVTGGVRAVGGLSVSGVNPSLRRATTQQWNVSVERALPWRVSMRTSYVGTKGTQLPYRRNANTPPPSLTPFGPGRLNFPQWSGVTYGDHGGNLTYHALDMQWRRSFAQGVYFDASYTWAKQLTDVDEDGTQFGWGAQGAFGRTIENPYDRAREKGNAHSIPRQRFRALFVAELPFGKGKRFGSDLAGLGGAVFNSVLGGWSFSGMFQRFTGWWYSPLSSGFDAANTGQFTIRPDRVGSGRPAGGQSDTNIFNANDFVRPEAGRYGNAGARIIQGLPGTSLDSSVWKSVALWSRNDHKVNMRFGATASNLLNHPAKSTWSTGAYIINNRATVARADDYYYTSVISGGLGSFRYIRFEAAIQF
jgi:hypothetical protein